MVVLLWFHQLSSPVYKMALRCHLNLKGRMPSDPSRCMLQCLLLVRCAYVPPSQLEKFLTKILHEWWTLVASQSRGEYSNICLQLHSCSLISWASLYELVKMALRCYLPVVCHSVGCLKYDKTFSRVYQVFKRPKWWWENWGFSIFYVIFEHKVSVLNGDRL